MGVLLLLLQLLARDPPLQAEALEKALTSRVQLARFLQPHIVCQVVDADDPELVDLLVDVERHELQRQDLDHDHIFQPRRGTRSRWPGLWPADLDHLRDFESRGFVRGNQGQSIGLWSEFSRVWRIHVANVNVVGFNHGVGA